MSSRIAAAALLLLLIPSLAFGAAEVSWKKDFPSLMKAAEQEQKLVLIDFYTSWCQYCATLDEESFGDPRIVALVNEHFVAAKLDAEVQKAAAMRYRPVGFPTVVFATPDGDEILRFSGYRTPDQVLTVVERVREVGTRMAELLATVKKQRKDFAAQLELGKIYLDLGLTDKAEQRLKRAAKLASDDAGRREAQHLSARALLLAGEYKRCCKLLDKLLAEGEGGAKAEAWLRTLEEAYREWGKEDRAEEVRATRLARFPERG